MRREINRRNEGRKKGKKDRMEQERRKEWMKETNKQTNKCASFVSQNKKIRGGGQQLSPNLQHQSLLSSKQTSSCWCY